MRSTLDRNRAYGLQHFGDRWNTLNIDCTGVVRLPQEGPQFCFLDPNGGDRTVFLPEIPENGGLLLAVANTGVVNVLSVVDDDGVDVADLLQGECGIFFSSLTTWQVCISSTFGIAWLRAMLAAPRIVTVDEVTVLATDFTVIVNRAAPATATTVFLPSSEDRNGIPVRIVDLSTAIPAEGHEIVLTPDGAETIMRGDTFSMFSSASQPGSLASLTLYPITTGVSGWYTG